MPRREATAFKSQVMSRPKPRTKGIVASARNMTLNPPSGRMKSAVKPEEWQSRAWGFFDTSPEFHYIATWVGNVMSKAILTVYKDGKLVNPAEDPIAKGALASLFGGVDNHAEMFRQFGQHLTVTGDCYLIGGQDPEDPEADDWMVAASTQTNWEKRGAEGQTWKIGGILQYQDPLAIRLWRPHPVFPWLSDSPTRAVLPILSELDGLTKHIGAQIDSRLSSAGILVLPSEISFAGTPSETTDSDGVSVTDEQSGSDGFVEELIRVAQAAIQDRGNASAVVPIVLQVAGEFVDKVKYLTFSSALDKAAINMRNEAIRRLALGMDTPPEVLEGTSDMNHWSSWQIEEAAIKVHTEPMLKIITSSLTKGYLRSYVEEFGNGADSSAYTFGYDDSQMRLRPNRSQEALELWDRGALGADALLRETGFDALDKMDDNEQRQWLLLKIAGGSATPDMINAALKLLGLDLGVQAITVSETITDDQNAPNESRPAPSLEDHPSRELPDTQDATAAGLLEPSELLVMRALERAGNRIKSFTSTNLDGVMARDIYLYAPVGTESLERVLKDAWTWSEMLAHRHGVEPERYQKTLDDYTRMLLVEHKKIDRDLLLSHLELLQVPKAA